jgi:hypothetical protein
MACLVGLCHQASDPCFEAFIWTGPLDCSSVEAEALYAGLAFTPTQDPAPGEMLQEESREASDPASPRMPMPVLQEESREAIDPASPRMPLPPGVKSSLQDEDEARSASGSPLPPFKQLLTPPPAPQPSLKVYSRRRSRAAGGRKMQQEAVDSAPVDLTDHTEHQQVVPSAAGVEGTAVPLSAEARPTAVPSKDDFISSITSKVSSLLPVSNIKGRRVCGSAPSSTSRRSRCIAGVGDEFQASDLTTRAKKH